MFIKMSGHPLMISHSHSHKIIYSADIIHSHTLSHLTLQLRRLIRTLEQKQVFNQNLTLFQFFYDNIHYIIHISLAPSHLFLLFSLQK